MSDRFTHLSHMKRLPAKRLASLLWQATVWAAVLGTALFPSLAFAQVSASICGPLEGGYGPYDYRGADPYKLGLVEGTHFTAPVEALVRGHTATRAGGDLNYTLRAFPNHHRALLAVVRYGEKFNSQNPPQLGYSVECWFERALRFRRDDYIVRLIYASYLDKQNRLPDALEQLRIAATEAKDNPFTHYNIGLVYFDLKQYDKALEQAHRAMEMEFPRVELRDQLIRIGRWHEPAPKKP
jgi:hypothetical protein